MEFGKAIWVSPPWREKPHTKSDAEKQFYIPLSTTPTQAGNQHIKHGYV